jgi:hypothetical protein
MGGDDLAGAFEEHLRVALQRAEDGFPAFTVDSWSDPAAIGQWVAIEDDEGRRSQARLDELIVRGLRLLPGALARSAGRLVDAVLGELRCSIAGGGTIVSRPLPEPEYREGLLVAHLEFRGIWLRLTAGPDPIRGGTMAVLSCLLGRAVPLAEPVEEVVWL